jgi:hypothetical protein
MLKEERKTWLNARLHMLFVTNRFDECSRLIEYMESEQILENHDYAQYVKGDINMIKTLTL